MDVWLETVKSKSNHANGSVQKRPRLKKIHQVRSNVKVLLTVFFDCNGVRHHDFLPQGHMVSKEYYLEVKSRLLEAISQKRIELWKNRSWILHHDNAPAHTTMFVQEFLAKNKTVIITQPSYSPSLVPPLSFSASQN